MIKNTNIYSIGVLAFSIVVFLFAVVSTTGEKVEAQSSSDKPFGGKMLEVIFECECEPCDYVEIGDPKGGKLMYCDPYTLYDHKKPNPTRWQLGMKGSSRTCHEIVCSPECVCEYYGSGPEVIMVGTSLY